MAYYTSTQYLICPKRIGRFHHLQKDTSFRRALLRCNFNIVCQNKFRQGCKQNSKFQIKLHQQIHKIQFLSYFFLLYLRSHTTEKGEKDMVGIFFTLSVRALSDVDTYYYGINVCLDGTS